MLLARDFILKFVVLINKLKIIEINVNNQVIPLKLRNGYWFPMISCILTNSVN